MSPTTSLLHSIPSPPSSLTMAIIPFILLPSFSTQRTPYLPFLTLPFIFISSGGAGDSTAISYLTEALKNSGTNDVVQHGACLGVGLAAMATGDEVLIYSRSLYIHLSVYLSHVCLHSFVSILHNPPSLSINFLRLAGFFSLFQIFVLFPCP